MPSVDRAPCRYNLDPSERSIKDRDKFLFFSSRDNILLRLNKHKTYRLKFLYRKTFMTSLIVKRESKSAERNITFRVNLCNTCNAF